MYIFTKSLVSHGLHNRLGHVANFMFCPHIVSRGDWLWIPANFKGTSYCFGFNVETYHHVTLTLHSLFQSKMADGGDFLNGDELEAILDISEAEAEGDGTRS